MTTPPDDGGEARADTVDGRYDVFLSYNSRDRQDVQHLAKKLRGAGLEPWLDVWRLIPGAHWQEGLANGLQSSSTCALFVGPHGLGNWSRLEIELAQDRAAKDRAFRLFAVLLPGLPEPFEPTTSLPPFLVATSTWVDLRQGLNDPRGFQALVNAIKGVPFGPEAPAAPRADEAPPYRGLQRFDEEQADLFFGREGDVQRLLEKLKAGRFLAVLGPSGSGKSSLLRAGLLPALRRGAIPGSDTWQIEIFTPGARPLESLAARLVRRSPGETMGRTLDQLAADPRTLHLSAGLALAESPPGERLVLVVDQFEEVFTLGHDEGQRAAFLDGLLYAATVPDGRCVVLLALRADFYPHCAAFPKLAALVSAQQYLVSDLGEEGLRRAIEEPAWRVGLRFEDGLVDTILEDVAHQPGALPLLQHALLELWARRRAGLMTLEGYRASGGVSGALAQRAEEVYAEFTPEQQDLLRGVLLRLTVPGVAAADTRRRAALAELVTRPKQREAVEGVVRALTDARLLTTSVREETGEAVVEVAHEALIRDWPRLRGLGRRGSHRPARAPAADRGSPRVGTTARRGGAVPRGAAGCGTGVARAQPGGAERT